MISYQRKAHWVITNLWEDYLSNLLKKRIKLKKLRNKYHIWRRSFYFWLKVHIKESNSMVMNSKNTLRVFQSTRREYIISGSDLWKESKISVWMDFKRLVLKLLIKLLSGTSVWIKMEISPTIRRSWESTKLNREGKEHNLNKRISLNLDILIS